MIDFKFFTYHITRQHGSRRSLSLASGGEVDGGRAGPGLARGPLFPEHDIAQNEIDGQESEVVARRLAAGLLHGE